MNWIRNWKDRGHRFVRYADDLLIFCKSRRSAERTLENILPFIEKKLFLKVNQRENSGGLRRESQISWILILPTQRESESQNTSEIDCKDESQNKRTNIEKQWNGERDRAEKLKRYIMGWVNYFKIADMKKLLQTTDEWMRRRIRMIYWKQWKRVKNKI